jgi:hypothetical protein
MPANPPARPSKARRFDPVAAPTAPTASHGAAAASAPRRAAKAPSATEEPKRAAFTWRRTPSEALAMDELAIRLKRELERAKLDHSEILAALVEVASESPAVFGALAGKLQSAD